MARAETNAGNPLRVTLGISSNGVFALSKSVPKLNSLITGSRHNLTVVHREGNRKDILGVSNEATSGASRVDLPKTKSSVPGSRKSELSIRGDDNITDEVRVSPQGTLGISVGVVVATRVSEAPDEDGLVTRSGKDEVGVLRGGGDGGHPVVVALEGSAEAKSFGHGCLVGGRKDVESSWSSRRRMRRVKKAGNWMVCRSPSRNSRLSPQKQVKGNSTSPLSSYSVNNTDSSLQIHQPWRKFNSGGSGYSAA